MTWHYLARFLISLGGALTMMLMACAPAAPPTPTPAPKPGPAGTPLAPAAQPTAAPKPAAPAPTAAPAKPAAPAPTAAPAKPAATAPAKPAAQEKATLRLSFKATGHRSPHVIGLEKGFYAAEGLNVELNEGSGDVPTGQLIAGKKEDFGLVGSEALLALIQEGAPLKSVFLSYQKNPYTLTILKEKNVRTPKDLEGKTVAVTPGTQGNYMMPTFLRVNGVNADKVTVVSVDSGARNQALISKRVDAIGSFINDSHIVVGQQVEVTSLLFTDWGIPTVGESVVVHLDTIKEKPDLIRRFLRAFRKAHEYTKANPDEAANALLKHYPTNKKEVVLLQIPATFAIMENDLTNKNGLGYASPESWQKTQDLLKEVGYLKSTAPIDRISTNEFLPPR